MEATSNGVVECLEDKLRQNVKVRPFVVWRGEPGASHARDGNFPVLSSRITSSLSGGDGGMVCGTNLKFVFVTRPHTVCIRTGLKLDGAEQLHLGKMLRGVIFVLEEPSSSRPARPLRR